MRSDLAPGEKLLTKGEVAQLCRVEVRTVDRWITAGKMKYYRTRAAACCFERATC
jgi:excisionase family DNA binding protein